MTDNFKEIGSLFGREGAGAGFAKQTDKESFTYAFAWPEGDTWAILTGYLNLYEQPEEYVRRVLQDGGFRSDWGNPDYDPIGDFKGRAGRSRMERLPAWKGTSPLSVDPEAGRRPSMISGTVSLRAATTFPWRATTAHPAGTRSRRMHLQGMRPERITRTSDRTRSDKK